MTVATRLMRVRLSPLGSLGTLAGVATAVTIASS
jgi:hypothetical protein